MKRSLFTLILLAGLILSACAAPQTYPAPAPLSLSGLTYQASDIAPVAIALDASGTSHIARLECEIDHPEICDFKYQAMAAGRQQASFIWPASAGDTFRNPDIAVTDDGLAVMVWQHCVIATNSCDTWMMRSNDFNQAYALDVGQNSRGVPLVVSRGNEVYAVHERTNAAGGSSLHYCRVFSATMDCHMVSINATAVLHTDAAAAVSSAGTLHVSYLVKAASSMTAYYADNAGDTTKDMMVSPNHVINLGAATQYFPPAIAIETDDGYAYIALGRDETTSDALSIHYVSLYTAGTHAVVNFNLPAADQWNIYGRPSITANAQSAYIAFSALTADTDTEGDIYQVGYTIGDSGDIPTRPYPTSLGVNLLDCDPVIILVDGLSVIGWHICSPYAERDALYFYSIYGGQVIHRPDTFMDGLGSLDMASNGVHVAGVWNEFREDGKLATWFAYNANMLWLPAVKK